MTRTKIIISRKGFDSQYGGCFSLISNPDDPDSGNLYRELSFLEAVYEDINDYYEEKADSRETTEKR